MLKDLPKRERIKHLAFSLIQLRDLLHSYVLNHKVILKSQRYLEITKVNYLELLEHGLPGFVKLL